MKQKFGFLLRVIFFFIPIIAEITYAENSDNRTKILFNAGWLFANWDIANGQSIGLKENGFTSVCLPHTVAIVPHSSIDTSLFARISWYRKHFTIPQQYTGKRFYIEFEAVAKVADVFINGQQVGEHKGAYTSFSFDITNNVKFGSDNVIAVRVDSRQHHDIPPEGSKMDYMIGGGIVRNVSIIVTNPLHVDWVFVSNDTAQIDHFAIKARIVNKSNAPSLCSVISHVEDSAGATIATFKSAQTLLQPDSGVEFSGYTSTIAAPRFWHPDHPYLYTVKIALEDSAQCVDDYVLKTGLRSIAFSKTEGYFSINGRPLKLRGLNRHETYPFIGRAAADRLQAKDADILKYDLGCNIVRCSHYPQSPAFLDRCDAVGLMVLEEMPGWINVTEKPEWMGLALHNVEDMIVRDRNHPSIISFGVRINESADFHDFYVKTNQIARALDPSRPTHGVRVRGYSSKQEFLEDVWVYNFSVPSGTPRVMPWITGEHVGSWCKTHSWDGDRLLIRQMLAFASVNDSSYANPKVAGLLGWAGFDYNSPYIYAEKSVCYHGVADIFRFPKFAGWFYKSQTDPALYGPMVYLANSWKKTPAPENVWVVSNCDKVELFVNNVSQGKKSPNRYLSLPHPLFVWDSIAFKTGEIKAVGFIGDSIVATFVRTTPGAAKKLLMTPDDTLLYEGGDMTRIAISAIDTNGQTVPQGANIVTISVRGPGDFLGERSIAIENGQTAFFVKTRAKQFGVITCTVTSKNLPQAHATIVVRENPLCRQWGE